MITSSQIVFIYINNLMPEDDIARFGYAQDMFTHAQKENSIIRRF